jgi:hypothetical protein
MAKNPHDTLVKAIFGKPEHMAGELAAVLPAEMTRDLDLATLTLIGTELGAEPGRNAVCTDLLFQVRGKTHDVTLVQLLVEHLSTPDFQVPERFLDYLAPAFRSWRRQGETGPRPPIIPVLICHGPRKWRPPRSFAQGYSLPVDSSWRHLLLDFTIVVDDLARETDERLHARVASEAARLALLILRHAHSRSLMDHLEKWSDLWARITLAPSGVMAFTDLVRYIADVNPHASQDRLLRLVPVQAEEARRIMPTLFQKERQQGHREILLHQLGIRFGKLPDEVIERVQRASGKQLLTWSERVVTEATLAKVFKR